MCQPGPPLAPRRVPRRLARLRGLPEREVHRAALRLVDLDPRTGRLAQLVERAVRQLAVAGERLDVEVDAVVGHVRVPAVDQLPDQLEHAGRCTRWRGGRGRDGGRRAAPSRRTTPARTRRELGLGGAALGGAGDDLVLDVGDVAHVGRRRAPTTRGTGGSRRRRGPSGRDRRGRRRRRWGRTRRSTPSRARGARGPPCRAATCRGSGRPWPSSDGVSRPSSCVRSERSSVAPPSERPRPGLRSGEADRRAFEQRDRPHRDALAAPDGADALAALGLDRDEHVVAEDGHEVRAPSQSMCGPSRGCSAAITTSTLTTDQPAARDARDHVAQQLERRRVAVSVVDAGNSVPRSGSPAGPSSASATAWATASASECPARPGDRRGGHRRARAARSSSANGCTS